MRFKTSAAVLALLFIGIAASGDGRAIKIPARDIGKKAVILGHLEIPIGRKAIIHGMKKKLGPDANCFIFDTLYGKPIAADGQKAIFVRCRGIADWPDGTEATIEGREQGTIMYWDMDANGDKRLPARQAIFLQFDVEKVVEPRGLKIRNLTPQEARESAIAQDEPSE